VKPVRRLTAVRQRLPDRRPRALVLVYHRVGQRNLDPWRLMVEPEIFAEHMETLARDWYPLSLAELVEGFSRRCLPERAVAVTFDDGYADNLEVAAPILLEHGIPTTLFVATEPVDSSGSLWWDELASLLLEPAELPTTLTLSSCEDRKWQIPPLSADQRWSAEDAPPPWEADRETRLRAFYEVWLALRALDVQTRETALQEIAEWAGSTRPQSRALLTWDQVQEFASLPRFDFGAHTLTHPDLPSRSAEDARTEIAGGADRLASQIGMQVEHFAYPFGSWSRSVARLVADLGFRAAYTTEGSAISWRSSPHALPRVPAENQAPADFARLLAGLVGH
jgi:peptidoglycan/xylan/chitin deacetylase (PgdA/CDA1 family)